MRPITTATLMLATLAGLSGCAAYPAPAGAPLAAAPTLVATKAVAPAAARQVRINGRLKVTAAPSFKLKTAAGFEAWGMDDVARLVVTVEEGGDTIDTVERTGPMTGDEAFVLDNLKTDRLYTISLAAYNADDDLISDPDLSTVDVDTTADEAGAYEDELDVTFELQLADRVFPGKVTANVDLGNIGADGVEVVLQRYDAVNDDWEDVQGTALSGSGYAAFTNLRVGESYRIEARPVEDGVYGTSAYSEEFVADPADADVDGVLPDVYVDFNVPPP